MICSAALSASEAQKTWEKTGKEMGSKYGVGDADKLIIVMIHDIFGLSFSSLVTTQKKVIMGIHKAWHGRRSVNLHSVGIESRLIWHGTATKKKENE